MTAGRLALVVASAVAASACNQPTSDPNEVVSMTLDTLSAPSIVAGDTLRVGDDTTLGRLTATAYNIKGVRLPSAVRFLPLTPTLLSIDPAGHVFAADSAPASARVIADASGFQSPAITIPITFRPDSLARDPTADTTQFNRGLCNPAGPISRGINAFLFHRPDTGFTPVGVANYLVHWAIVTPDSAGLGGTQTGTRADTALKAYVSDLAGNSTLLDTTKAGGMTTRAVTFSTPAFRQNTIDTLTVVVQATARYQGRQLRVTVIDTLKFLNPPKC